MKLRPIIFTLFILLLSACVLFAADTVKESSTGKIFKTEKVFKIGDNSFDAVCTGVGVRKKFIFKVYGLGLYMDKTFHNKMKDKWMKKYSSVDDLIDDDNFFKDLVYNDYFHQFDMEFVRTVSAKKIRNAFDDDLKDNLPQMKKDPTLKAAAQKFVSFFQNEVKDGDALMVNILPDGTIVVSQNDKELGRLKNNTVAHALNAIWLGEDCISNSLKEDLVQFFYK